MVGGVREETWANQGGMTLPPKIPPTPQEVPAEAVPNEPHVVSSIAGL